MNSKCLGIKVKSSCHVSDCISPYGMFSFLDPVHMSRMFLFSMTSLCLAPGGRLGACVCWHVLQCLLLRARIAVRPALAPPLPLRTLPGAHAPLWVRGQAGCLSRVAPGSNWWTQSVSDKPGVSLHVSLHLLKSFFA